MKLICSSCGKTIRKAYPGGMCEGCYNYFRKGGTVSPLPPRGVVARDHRGYVVCHICGRAYKRLGSHARESHGLTIAEYKSKFGLCGSAKTTERMYSERMKRLAYQYDMPDMLKEAGKGTRIKAGEKHLRYGKKSRLQECRERSERNSKKKVNKYA